MNAEMIITTSVVAMLDQRNVIKSKVENACQKLCEAMAIELSTTGQRYSNLESFLCGGGLSFFSLSRPEETAKRAMKHVDAQFWNALMDKSGILAFMSAEKQNDFNKLIGEAKTPPFEFDTIKTTFAELYEKRADMMEEGIIGLFRRLSWDYRTNNPVKIGKKIVVNNVLDYYGFINKKAMNELDDLVRILSVYDGKPIPEHRHGMYAVIADAMAQKDSVVDTEYFTMKVYKKGSGHIVFKDNALPLLDQCNRVIARAFPGALPAASGRKAA